MAKFDFSEFPNVELMGADLTALDEDQLTILYQQARYCQAMTDADTKAMEQMTSEDITYTHMSGMQQTREAYFTDIRRGALRYFTIGIDHPKIVAEGDCAHITYTAVLNASAYGARGTFRMKGTHWYEKRGGQWILVNGPDT